MGGESLFRKDLGRWLVHLTFVFVIFRFWFIYFSLGWLWNCINSRFAWKFTNILNIQRNPKGRGKQLQKKQRSLSKPSSKLKTSPIFQNALRLVEFRGPCHLNLQ